MGEMPAAIMPQMNMGGQNQPYQPQMDPRTRLQGVAILDSLGEVALEAAILAFAGSVGAFSFEVLVSSSEKILEFIAGMAYGDGVSADQIAKAKLAKEETLTDEQLAELEKVKAFVRSQLSLLPFVQNAGAPNGMPAFANMGMPMSNVPQQQPRPASRDRYEEEDDDDDDDYDDESRRRKSRRRRHVEDDFDDDDDFMNMSDRQYRRALEKRQRKLEKRTEAIGSKLSTLILVSVLLSPFIGCAMNTWGPTLLNWGWEKFEYVLRMPGIDYVYTLEKEEEEAARERQRSIEKQAADVEALIKAREAGDTAREAMIMVEMQGTSIDAYYKSKEYAAKSKEKAEIEEKFGRKTVEEDVVTPPKEDKKPSSEVEPAPAASKAASDTPVESEVESDEKKDG
jgi:hypothetical protein